MSWMIPAKLKKRVSYAQFSVILSPGEWPSLFYIRQWIGINIMDGSFSGQDVKLEIAADSESNVSNTVISFVITSS